MVIETRVVVSIQLVGNLDREAFVSGLTFWASTVTDATTTKERTSAIFILAIECLCKS